MIQSSCARCSVTEARQGRFVQATEALLHPTPVLDYMHAAETHIDILCSSWIAHNAAVQRVNEVMADARRSMEYEVAVCELVRIREDVEATFVRFVAAVDGIKVSVGSKAPYCNLSYVTGDREEYRRPCHAELFHDISGWTDDLG